MSESHLSFEDALTELEALVDTLEQDNLSLDESLMRFGNGLITSRAKHGVEMQAMRLSAVDPKCFALNVNKL
jgi:exodeoxyribonuclease VII small subunit